MLPVTKERRKQFDQILDEPRYITDSLSPKATLRDLFNYHLASFVQAKEPYDYENNKEENIRI